MSRTLEDCVCGELAALCPHLGTFDMGPGTYQEKWEAKRATLLDLNAAFSKLDDSLPLLEVKRLAMLAEHTGANRYLPDWLKDAMQTICKVAPYAERLPEDQRIQLLKTSAKVVGAVCQILGQ